MNSGAGEPKTTAIEAADADDWVSLGPDGRLLQLPLWSGRMNDVAFDPNTPGLMYAASPAGGVFRSDDNGSYWYPMSDRKVVDPFTGSLWKSGLHTSHIVALNNSHLIVATGDTDLRAGGFGYDNPPFYLSVDGGVTWRKSGLPCVNPAELDSPSGTVYQLLVDPETNTLFASVGGSIYRSDSEGNCWHKIDPPVSVSGGLPIFDIALQRPIGRIQIPPGRTVNGAYLYAIANASGDKATARGLSSLLFMTTDAHAASVDWSRATTSPTRHCTY